MEFPNVMEEDYSSVGFNSYVSGPGAGLPVEHLPSYARKKDSKEVKGFTLYIRRIPSDMTKDGLKNLFSPYGNVLRSFVGVPRKELQTCYGFLDYATMKEAERAIRELHRKPPLNLLIEFASSQEEIQLKNRIKKEEDARMQEKIRAYTSSKYGNDYYNECEDVTNKKLVVQVEENTQPLYRYMPPVSTCTPESSCSGMSLGRGFTPRSQGRTIRESYFRNGSVERGILSEPPIDRGQNSLFYYLPEASPQLYRFCTYCGKPADFNCQRCKAFYCSPRCQDDDWSKHQNICRSVDEVHNYEDKQSQDFSFARWKPSKTDRVPNQNTRSSDSSNQMLPKFIKQQEKTKSAQSDYRGDVGWGKSNDDAFSKENRKSLSQSKVMKEPSLSTADADKRLPWKMKSDEPSTVNNSAQNGKGKTLPLMMNEKNRGKDTGRKMPGNYNEKDIVSLGTVTNLDCSEAYNPPSILRYFCNNQEVKFIVMLVDSVFDFWLTAHLPEFVAKMAYCEKKLTAKSSCESYRASDGEVIAAYSEDFRAWYRAYVISHSASEYLVHYIDYGNSEKTNRIKPLSDDLKVLPSLTVHCVVENSLNRELRSTLEKIITPESVVVGRVKTGECTKFELLSPTNGSVLFSVDAHPWYHKISAQIKNQSLVGNAGITGKLLEGTRSKEKPQNKTPVIAAKFQRETKLSQCHIKEITKVRLSVNQKINVEIVHINSAKQIYAQDVRKKDVLMALLTQIHHYCSEENTDSYCPKKDEVVCAKFEDVWYRAAVISAERETNFHVHFIDYGNDHTVAAQDIRPSKKDFLKDPCLTFCVELENVSELDSTTSDVLRSKQWVMEPVKIFGENISVRLSDETLCVNDILGNVAEKKNSPFLKDSLQKTVFRQGQRVDVEVSFIQSAKNVYVQLVEEKQKHTKMMSEIQDYCTKLNTELYHPQVDEIVCAKFIDDIWYRACAVSPADGQSYKVYFIDYGNEHVVAYTDIRPIDTNLTGYPIMALCVQLDRVVELDADSSNALQSEQWLMEAVTVEDERLVVKMSKGTLCINDILGTEDKGKYVAVFRSDLSKNVLYSSQKVGVNVVYVKSDKEIYVQLTENEEALLKMTSEIQEYCSKLKSNSYTPQLGEVVCAKFTDELWYRACILQQADSSQCEVHFVDFGNDSTISTEDIRPISKELAVYPVFSICVELDQVPSIDIESLKVLIGEWMMEVITPKEPSSVILRRGTVCVNDIFCAEKVANKVANCHVFTKNDMPDSSLKVGQKMDVIVVHLQDDKLYVQPVDSSDDLLTVMPKIQDHCMHEDVKFYSPNVDEMVCAKFIDERWYRAVVLHADEHEMLRVRFIDFGNEHVLPVGDVRCFSSEFAKLEACALCVKRDGVSIVEESQTNALLDKRWTMEVLNVEDGVPVVKLFNETCGSDIFMANSSKKLFLLSELPKISLMIGQNIDVQVVFVQSAEKVYVQPTSNNENLMSLMKGVQDYCASTTATSFIPQKHEMVCAKFIDGVWYRAHTLELVGENGYNVHFVDYGNEHVVALEDIRPFSGDFINVPVGALCVELEEVSVVGSDSLHVLQSGQWIMEIIHLEDERTVVKLAREGLCVNDVLSDDVTIKEKCILINDIQKISLTIGQKVDVQVVFVQSDKKVYAQPTSGSEKLLALMKNVQDYCMNMSIVSFSPRKDEMVCVKYIDGLWYRACILELVGEKSYNVHFVDYGNDYVSSLENIRPFSKDFIDVPVCAFCVELDGVSTIDVNTSNILLSNQWVMEIVMVDGEHILVKLGRENLCFNSILNNGEEEKKRIFRKDLPKTFLKEGQKISVQVVFVQSAEKVYVQLTLNRERLSALMRLVQDYCKCANVDIFTPQKDEMVCAKFTDGVWYRAQVVEPVGDNSYKVQFVDYGNYHVVSPKELRPFIEDFSNDPVGAVEVSDVDASNASILAGEWIMEVIAANDCRVLVKLRTDTCCANDVSNEVSEQAISFKTDLPKTDLTMGEKSVVQVVFIHSAEQIYVQKIEKREELSMLMANIQSYCTKTCDAAYSPRRDEMVCAKFTDGVWYRAHAIEPESDQKYNVHFVDYGNKCAVALEDIQPFSREFLKCPAAAFCIQLHNIGNIDPQALVMLGEQKWNLEVVAVADGKPIVKLSNGAICANDVLATVKETADKVFRKDICKRVLSIGQKICINVVHIESGKEIYVQLASEKDELAKLMQEMHKYCVNRDDEQYCPQKEELVCAKFTDGIWYRAYVLDETGNSCFKVHFIDYGNSHVVMSQDIRPITKDFTFYPAGAVCVGLHGVSTINIDVADILCKMEWTMEVVTHEASHIIVRLFSGDICANDIIAEPEETVSSEKDAAFVIKGTFSMAELRNTPLELHQKLTVKVVFVKSATQMYVQVLEQQSILSSLMKEIQEHCESTNMEGADVLVVGDVICGRFMDVWYRARVLAVEEENRFKVDMFDYGRECVIGLSDIRQFHEKFLELPVSAICMRMDGVTQLDDEVVCALEREELTMEVLGLENNCVVAKISISDICVNEVLGATVDESPISQQEPEKLPSFSFDDCPSTSLTVGKKVTVVVTSVLSPDIFFCQLSDEGKLQQLNDLNKEISNCCKEEASFRPAANQICVAYCNDRKAWLRAVILKLEPLTVVFPDYGHTAQIASDHTSLRPIRPEFVTFPWQAVQCSLAGIKSEMTWSKNVLGELHLLLPEGKVIEITAIKSGDVCGFVVDIPFVLECLINKKLVEQDNMLPERKLLSATIYEENGRLLSSPPFSV